LARQEINLTGGEPSQNPHIVPIFQIFRTLTPKVCLHTNLDINSQESQRWKRLVEILNLGGRVDITLYPTAWERTQKSLLSRLLELENRILVNVVFETLPDLKHQLSLLTRFFQGRGASYREVTDLLQDYYGKVSDLVDTQPQCNESTYTRHMGDTGAFAESADLTLGINLLPAFQMDAQGRRAMTSLPFPNDNYLIECPAARGSIDIMTIRETGEMTPCCDVGNLQCRAKFGNLLHDSPDQILEQFERSSRKMASGILKNQENLKNARAGEWVEEGIPPYCG
ncbi:MAG: hypothetical protein GWM98_27700, partial [Nitrospinaceae bacterium]|nr:hypothetical protein [Nitrospinaceae bacterium]NIR57550.1 hypothetical protein [Nitrospinaceae bacterium]NIS88020.1 hypothetical protein [Nitrospinaceae bacterium]NIT84884.1 hypothetical protein [Nitrospinaceae bacterium]NIU47060.1 hypothetical protein [Nitrospinaceae bacterium]